MFSFDPHENLQFVKIIYSLGSIKFGISQKQLLLHFRKGLNFNLQWQPSWILIERNITQTLQIFLKYMQVKNKYKTTVFGLLISHLSHNVPVKHKGIDPYFKYHNWSKNSGLRLLMFTFTFSYIVTTSQTLLEM